MTKGIIITGPRHLTAGKAIDIAGDPSSPTIEWISIWDNEGWMCDLRLFSQCTMKTDTIILTGLRNAQDINFLFSCVSEGITVRRENESPFKINPQIIVTCGHHILKEHMDRTDVLKRFILVDAGIQVKDYTSRIIYQTEDGKKFLDRDEHMEHEFELNLRKLEAINKRRWIDIGMPWFILIVFVAGYLFGIFTALI